MVAGDRAMGLAAYMLAEENGFDFEGFEPTEEEQTRYERIKKLKAKKERGMAPAKPRR